MPKPRASARLLPYLPLVLGPLVLFGPMLAKGEALFWGTPMLQFVPWRTVAFGMLREGFLPLWNPYLGMGAPLLANYQSAFLYPPNLLLPLVGIPWGHGLLVMLHILWSGVGMSLLCRRLGLPPMAQVMSGLAFSMSGYLVARAGFLSINAAAAWLPWLVLFAETLVRRVTRGDPVRRVLLASMGLALGFAMQWLAGHAQTSWYSLILVCLWTGWRSFERGRWSGLGKAGAWMLGAGIFGFALSSAQLLPTLEYLAHSQREGLLDTEFAMTYSFWPWRLLGIIMPDLFGDPSSGSYWGYGAYWEDAIYVGLLPAVFALGSIIRSMKKDDQYTSSRRFLAIAAFVTILLALGRNTPVFPWLFRNVPTFDLFQAPARWNLLLVFALALLSGIGIASWKPVKGRWLYWVRLGTVGAFTLTMVALVGRWALPGVKPSFFSSFALAGAWLFISGIIALTRPAQVSRAWATVIGLVVMLDLVIAGWGLNPTLPASFYRGESQLASVVSSDLRLFMQSDLEEEIKFDWTHRFDTYDPDVAWEVVRDVGLPNVSMLDRLTSSNNFDPILPSRYPIWLRALEALPQGHQDRLLGLMGVGWKARIDTAEEHSIEYVPVEGASRVRMLGQAVWAASPEEALEKVLDPVFAPGRQIVLEGPPISGAPQVDDPGEAQIKRSEDPNLVAVDVRTDEGGWLLLADVQYPGWRVWLDEQETTMYRADYLFRGVWVPPGEHAVTFRFLPFSFFLGVGVSSLAWLCLAIATWRLRRALRLSSARLNTSVGG